MRRLYWMATATILIIVIAFAIVVANLKQIVLSRLQASFPGLRISVGSVSLKSLSHVRIARVRLSGPRGAEGSFVVMPEVDVRYRLDLLKGLVLESVGLPGVNATLRPGFGAILPSLAGPRREGRRVEKFPVGPSIGKVSLTNSRLDFSSPDFRLACSVEAIADSSSSGTLLENTDFSLKLEKVLLDLPSFRLRDVEPRLSALIVREPDGSRIHVLGGDLYLSDFLRSDFHGDLSFEESALTAKWQMEVQPFQTTDVLRHLKESFRELDPYRIEGSASAHLELDCRFGERSELSLSGEASVRRGRAVLPVPELLVVEDVEAYVPFCCSILDGKTTVTIGSDQRRLAGGRIAAARISYDEQELASDLLAFFEFQQDRAGNRVLKSLNAFFHSHGGNVDARLSGSLRSDVLNLEGELRAQDIGLDEVLGHLGVARDTVWGKAGGKARIYFTAGPKAALTLKADLRVRVPEAIVSFRKPLTIRGLEITTPFEYSAASNVQSIGIKPSEKYPLGGTVAAEKIGYGEKVNQDGTTSPQWSVSRLWANVASTGDTTELTIESCQAYDGELTGVITASLKEKGLTNHGELHLEDLDLESLAKGLGAKREKFYVNGLMGGTATFSGKEGQWDEVKAEFSSVPPGGILRVGDVEKLLDSLPGEAGKAVLEGLKKGLTPQQWKSFVEAMKEFRYRVATVKITYHPLRTALEAGLRAHGELHLEGAGAGQRFDITIPFTWDVI